MSKDPNHDAKVAGAAKPLIFKDPDDGSTLTLWPEPLSDKDNIELDAWVRAYYLYIQRSNISEDMMDEEKYRIERIAQETASTLSWWAGHGIRIMASIEGMTQIAYMSIRKRMPSITTDKLRAILMDERNLDEANKIFEELNLSEDLDAVNPLKRGRQKTQQTTRKATRKITPTAKKRARVQRRK